jgi:hypothetical protein
VTAPRRVATRVGFGVAVRAGVVTSANELVELTQNLPMACTVSVLPCGSVPASPEDTGDSLLRPSQTTIVALGYPSPSISTRSCL